MACQVTPNTLGIKLFKKGKVVNQQIEGSPESCTPNIHRFPYLAALLAVDYKLLDLFSPQLLVALQPVARKDVGIHDLTKGSPLGGNREPNNRELGMVVSSQSIRD
nr:hypothetical protein Itr_chr11CG08550 [Ipomoea trifida]